MAVAANNTGIIVLGGGVAKHHICNANAFVSIFLFLNDKEQPVGVLHDNVQQSEGRRSRAKID